MDLHLLAGALVAVAALLAVVATTLAVLLLRRPAADPSAAALSAQLARLEPVGQAVRSIELGLVEMQAQARARYEFERQTADAVRHLQLVIAGTHSKGAAGENVLEAVFAKLPPEWQMRNLPVGNKVVEFALRLPNKLALPIDSKWTATGLLEEFLACDDVAEQQALKRRIESEVLRRTRELRKYLDPNLTASFGVAAVPDAVFDLCAGIHADAFQQNVVIVSYSMFVPYLLLVYQSALQSRQTVDVEKLDAYLQSTIDVVRALQDELESRFSRALTMLTNSRHEMGVNLSQIHSRLVSIQAGTASPVAVAAAAAPPALPSQGPSPLPDAVSSPN